MYNKMCYIPNTVDGTVNWSGRCLNKEQSATLPASEVNLYQLTWKGLQGHIIEHEKEVTEW